MAERRVQVWMIAAIMLLALSVPAMAGGYAVVHLDEEPGEALEATPWRFGFMVLQHGVTPISDVVPVVRARHRETGEVVTATGVQEGAVGHFIAEVTFPRAGEWKWSIEPQPYAETTFAAITARNASAGRFWSDSPWARYSVNPSRFSEYQNAALAGDSNARTVEILDPWVFTPDSLRVSAGTTVTWQNRSETTHTVTGDDLAFDDSGPLAPGQAFSVIFDDPGTYRYRCGPHPDMVAEIVVT